MKSESKVPPRLTGFRQGTILLIDDDIDEHFLLEHSLEEMGLQKKLLSFYGCRQAINYLNQMNSADLPSLIISDYHMPAMNGKEVLMHLKGTAGLAHIPVIVYSTVMTASLEKELMQLGALACMVKTFDLKELTMALLGGESNRQDWND